MPAPVRSKLCIIDYMALVRKVLQETFKASPTIQVVATASNALLARQKILTTPPDVLLLDLQPPIERDVACLGELLVHLPLPLVLLTGLDDAPRRAVMEALHIKREYILAKPRTGLGRGLEAMQGDLESALRKAYQENLLAWQNTRRPLLSLPRHCIDAPDRVIAIGASTGGTEALCEILSQLPCETPGMVIVQHMPEGFTRPFAQRLNALSALEVKEAADGDAVCPGRALLAPGGYQMRLVRASQGYRVRVTREEKVNGHCPSVDVLMTSVAKNAGARGIGILLTGMGSDGAEGMKAMRHTGAMTLAQDERTSVVFGMPKEAYQRGGVEKLVPLQDIAKHLVATLTE